MLEHNKGNELLGEAVIDKTMSMLCHNSQNHNIRLLQIYGEIEGHDLLNTSTKSTKYEEVMPYLAEIEDNSQIDGLLVLIHTLGGDVEAGLAIAEMLQSISKPVVTLVLGGGHSIGVPLSVAGDMSFIAETATMMIHPIRITGTVLGARQNYEYINKMQDRIVDFSVKHSAINRTEFKQFMFNNRQLSKDIGTMFVGKEAVDVGLIKAVGGIREALGYLHQLIDRYQSKERD